MSYVSKGELVRLWHETQMGNIHTCREKQLEFSDIMWRLYEDLQRINIIDSDEDCDKYHEKQDDKAMKNNFYNEDGSKKYD